MNKVLLALLALVIWACGGSSTKPATTETPAPAVESTPAPTNAPTEESVRAKSDSKGIGKFTNVTVSPQLDIAKAKAGEAVFKAKCFACHKLTEEKLIGPGWKGVTERRTPEWIMNFAVDPERMQNEDSLAKVLVEVYKVKMTNQSITDEDARNVYEFMRQNDGVK